MDKPRHLRIHPHFLLHLTIHPLKSYGAQEPCESRGGRPGLTNKPSSFCGRKAPWKEVELSLIYMLTKANMEPRAEDVDHHILSRDS